MRGEIDALVGGIPRSEQASEHQMDTIEDKQ